MAHLYMGLLAGNLVVLVHLDRMQSPLMTFNLTLSDDRWHNASIAYTRNGYVFFIRNLTKALLLS